MRTAEVVASLVTHLESNAQVSRVALAEIALDGAWGSNGRIDVAAVEFKPNHVIEISGFEVKISRADFTKDVDTGKILKYRNAVDRLYYACPQDLIRVNELPAGIGLITVNRSGVWRTIRRADIAPREETGQLVRMMRRMSNDRDRDAYDRHRVATADRLLRMFDNAADLAAAERQWGAWLGAATSKRIFDLAVAEGQIEHRLEDAQRTVARAQERADRIIADAHRQAAAISDIGPTIDAFRSVVGLMNTIVGDRTNHEPFTVEEAAEVKALVARLDQTTRDRRREAVEQRLDCGE